MLTRVNVSHDSRVCFIVYSLIIIYPCQSVNAISTAPAVCMMQGKVMGCVRTAWTTPRVTCVRAVLTTSSEIQPRIRMIQTAVLVRWGYVGGWALSLAKQGVELQQIIISTLQSVLMSRLYIVGLGVQQASPQVWRWSDPLAHYEGNYYSAATITLCQQCYRSTRSNQLLFSLKGIICI